MAEPVATTAENQLNPTEYAAKVIYKGQLRDALAMLASATTALRKLTGSGPVARTVLEWRDCATDPPGHSHDVLIAWTSGRVRCLGIGFYERDEVLWYHTSSSSAEPTYWADVVLPDA